MFTRPRLALARYTLARCLADDPDHRPADAEALLAACTAAGLAALADFASEEAHAWLQRAHSECERAGLPAAPALLAALADVCSTTGRLSEAQQHLEVALARPGAPIDAALLHWRQARVRLYNLENERALADIGRAFAASSASGSPH